MARSNPNQISFWYPVKTIQQLTFDGARVFVDCPQEGHIVYQGRLICRQGMERIKAECGAKKQKTVSTRIQSIGICKKCQEGYKKNQDLDWVHWVRGRELKRETTVKILPDLLRGINDGKNNG